MAAAKKSDGVGPMDASSLRRWRTGRGFTQAEAADAAGVSQTLWALMESGDRSVTPAVASAISRSQPKHRSGGRGPYM